MWESAEKLVAIAAQGMLRAKEASVRGSIFPEVIIPRQIGWLASISTDE